MPTARIEPTVGRVVLFNGGHKQQLAAQIAAVNADGTFNIGYLMPNGSHDNAINVPLVQEGEPKPAGFYAEWMPYQKGQAAKTDEAEARAKGGKA
jgi:hypothetical protein